MRGCASAMPLTSRWRLACGVTKCQIHLQRAEPPPDDQMEPLPVAEEFRSVFRSPSAIITVV